MNIDLLAFLVFTLPVFIFLVRFGLMAYPESSLPEGMKVKKDLTFTPSIAVIVPCYNEGSPVFDSIRSIALSVYGGELSAYPQDDGSKDDSYEWMLKAQRDFPNVFPEQNEVNKGKTHTYIRAMNRSDSELVMIVDSDTTVAPDAIAKMAACFADERIGVVGAPLGATNPNHSMLTAIQTYLYMFGLRLAKISESHFQGVAVIGGYALMVRRHLLKELEPEILKRNWFGVPVKDGEDRFVTHLSLLRGWGTYVEQGAEIRSYAMDTYSKYFGQQLRWKRSLIRTFFWVIRTLPYQVRNMKPSALLALFGSGVTVTILLIGTLFTLGTNPAAIFDPAKFVTLAFVSCIVMIVCSLKSNLKDQYLNNPLRLLLFTAWWVVNLFYLVILSLGTLEKDSWGNREAHQKTILKGTTNDIATS